MAMQNSGSFRVQGAGLGLRRGLFRDLAALEERDGRLNVDFMELAPENWIGVGGRFGRQFRAYAERYPLVAHGLSLSIGSPAPLDVEFLRQTKEFLDTYQVRHFTEHLSFCGDHGQLYDLMPIPFTQEAVHYVAGRIAQVQDILERRIAMENISYYAAPGQELSELEFINAVIAEADCDLLLDVNNIYVNSINFRYDPVEFLQGLPGNRAVYIHVAGHYVEAEDLRVDTHGADVIDPVWTLLEQAYRHFGIMPTLLERDFNFPDKDQLMSEVQRIRDIQSLVSQSSGSTKTEPPHVAAG